MHSFVLVWLDPHPYVVVRCTACRRVDLRVRWPDPFDFCGRCGGCTFTTPEVRADGVGLDTGPLN